MASSVAPPPELTVSEWADSERVLSPESSSEPGRWSTDRVPYARAIMDAVNDPACHDIVVMSASQIGKTEILNNIIGYFIDYDPAPMMVMQPTLEMAQTWSKDRLAPMLRDTPCLMGKVSDAASRDSSNTILQKKFSGGLLAITGANSPASLASRPIRILLGDEIDRYPVSAGTEGDPVGLAEKRTSSFWNRKRIYVSTPTIKDVSRIEKLFKSGTQEYWNLPCPRCGFYQPLEWDGLIFDGVVYKCKNCGQTFKEHRWKNQPGKWIATNPSARTRSFAINALPSPISVPWDELIKEFLQAKHEGKESLKVFVNTRLGQTWEDPEIEEANVLKTEDLERNKSVFGDNVLPDGVLILTCGVDTQDDRLELEVVGWGLGRERWGIDYRVLMGDPAYPQVWNDLFEYLKKRYYYADGSSTVVACTCVDSGGHKTTSVYKFCRAAERAQARIYAIKGRGGDGVPLISKPTRNNRFKCALFAVGVDAFKTDIYAALTIKDEGPGFYHFPADGARGFDEAFFSGLVSERRELRYRMGVAYQQWVKRKPGLRNEPLDINVYAAAAFEILNPNLEMLAERGHWNPDDVAVKKETGWTVTLAEGLESD